MPGGKIAPDGRPAQAPGVGAQSKRHDLEMPGTPGLHGSDLQQGDVQMLEQGQRVAPRPKRTQQSAAPSPRAAGRAGRDASQMQVPDPIEMAGNRSGGVPFQEPSTRGPRVDPAPWMPLLEQFATRPQGNPMLTALYTSQLANLRRKNVSSIPTLIDMGDVDTALENR